MNAFALMGAAIAALAYLPLIIGTWRKQTELNFGTYLLWSALNAITTLPTVLAGGNYLLSAIYLACSLAVLAGIIKTGGFKWTRVETATTWLVLVCLLIWALGGGRAAIVASTLGVVLASIPQLVDFWKQPSTVPVKVFVLFTIANGLSIFGGNAWTIEERFYSTSCTILTLGFVLVAARKWLPGLRQQPA